MEEKIKALKKKLEKYSTREILGWIGIKFLTFADNPKEAAENANIFNKTNLISPQKQYVYLAGLLMSTQDKSDGSGANNSNEYKDLEEEIQNITFEYIKGFITDKALSDRNTLEKNEVSLAAFTSYFDTAPMRYPEQTIKLIRLLFDPFDNELIQITGLSVADYIEFYTFIKDTLQNEVDQLFNDDLQIKESDYIFPNENLKAKLMKVYRLLNLMFTVEARDVQKHFGEEKGRKLLDEFGLYRRERDFLYYNGDNPFSDKPLCWIDQKTLFVVNPQFLLNAICDHLTRILENPQNNFANKYRKSKGEIVEKQFLEYFKKIFGDSAYYHKNVCEERGTNEHDLVIEYDDYILIAEVKSSKVREPFFNPEKAYQRVYDNFYSKNGIGGAYSQAMALKKLMEGKNKITLYENKIFKFEITELKKKKILPIVLTLNQFGELAVNTSVILKKDPDEPYPWVCNLHDFDNLIVMMNYLRKKSSDFIGYITWRIRYHQNFIANDELDIAEQYFIGNKEVIENIKKNKVFFIPTGSKPDLIDKIYFQNVGEKFFIRED